VDGENYVMRTSYFVLFNIYGVITNDVSDYINLLVRIAHIIYNHSLLQLLYQAS
jgi:hypothetical protein